MNSKLIDTHFHLDYYRNHKQMYETINNLQQYTLCVTNSPGVFLSCKRMYPETKYIKFALGFHPQEILKDNLKMNEFKSLIKETNYIGEIGLDFSKTYIESKNLQIKHFETIIGLATYYNKIMSIHIRMAEEEALKILSQYDCKKVIIHWYTGKAELVNNFLDLGCYFSLNGNMLRTQQLLKKIESIPQNKILIESDGPFTKVDGNKYTPDLLNKIYKNVAETFLNDDIESIIFQNFSKLLRD